MTLRLEFGKADINYLANLCHNCGACLHASSTRRRMSLRLTCRRRWQKCGWKHINTMPSRRFRALYRRAGVTVRWRWVLD
ncbi:tricarballylate utilization protein B [Raoultella terrigena]|uniref:Tricarballylate utilization protein B n=1 Tax=Raoultella terrigena TaxID=577 RepID=A0A4U9DA76_RAOTE|nr:tricarballylate utilization protein B [Raoultella terrigena]